MVDDHAIILVHQLRPGTVNFLIMGAFCVSMRFFGGWSFAIPKKLQLKASIKPKEFIPNFFCLSWQLEDQINLGPGT